MFTKKKKNICDKQLYTYDFGCKGSEAFCWI